MKKIKLAIVEDIDDIRERLKSYFDAQEEFECLVASPSMESFFEQADDLEVPDIVLSDIGLPGMNGIEGMKKIKSLWPETDIVMLTVFKDNDKIFKSVCAGATGYILKDTPMPEIKKAVEEIVNGGSFMSPSIARKVMGYFAPARHTMNEPLTPKEKQIIMALADGLSYKMIGDKLLITIDTVRFHIKNIYKKLQVNTKLEVINKVRRGEI
jgi:DNA-binding NarL/FixJ family response regulator